MPVGLGWDAILAEFRALGGTAENIMLGQGPRDRGVFPVDPAKPVRLCSPTNLLVRAEDTEIRDGRFVVKASATLGERERVFFDNYQQDLSGALAFSTISGRRSSNGVSSRKGFRTLCQSARPASPNQAWNCVTSNI